MKKILNQITLIPILVLFYFMGLYLAIRINIQIDYVAYALIILLGIFIKYIRSKNTKYKKIINIACSLLTLVLFIALFFKPIKLVFDGIYSSIVDGNITPFIMGVGKAFNKSLLVPALYYFSFIVIRCIYQDVLVEKKVGVFSSFALIICFLGWLASGKIYVENIIIVALALLLKTLRSSYNNINSVGGIKLIIITLLFICCFAFAYLLSPFFENFNIRAGINFVVDGTGELINNITNKGEQSLDGELGDMLLSNESEELSDEIIMTIDSSYKIDRLKAYSCGKYDVKKNSFVIDKKIINKIDNDYSNLFIKNNKTTLPEYLHVSVNKKTDDVVYVPYGDLSFNEKAYLYNDQVVQFKNTENYNDYSLTFNPSEYYINIFDSKNILDKYQEYAKENYADSKNENILPTNIKKAIESFINEDSSYREYVVSDESLDSQLKQGGSNSYINRLNVYRINEYLNSKFTIKQSYERNSEGIDDISYALEHEHIANPQLMAAIATFMYRNENIPARFVVGYSVNDYEGNIAYIRENDKTYWSEVFIDGMWVPADDLFLPIGEGTKTQSNDGSQNSELGSISGDLKETFDDFSNSDENNEEEVIALTIETNYEVDRIKQTSYGDYNTKEHRFEYEEDISNYQSIKNADVVYDMNRFFKDLFIIDDNYKYYMKVTSYIPTNDAYVPYGMISMQDVSMYQDKAILFNENSYSYLINFEPYSNNKQFKSNSFYDDYVYEKYLSVPDEMVNELQEFLISKGIDYKSKDKAVIIRQVKNLLQEGEYTYTLKPGNVPEDKDLLMYFLLENKKGFCQHFAGAATLLYRICGIPARYTVGFAIDDYENGIAKATTKDAHAWVEVYTSNYGWKPIEVTASSKRDDFDISDIEIEYTSQDLDLEGSGNKSTNGNSQYNIQPEFTLGNQTTLDDDYTFVNNDYSEEEANKTVLSVSTNHEIYRIKAYSLGNYNVDEQKYYLGEDLSNQKDIAKISNLFDIDQFFISLFTNINAQEYEFNAKNYSDEKWLYVPYGILNINEANMYQDKYFYFDDETKYDDYSLTYSSIDNDNEFDIQHDYENFVYDYYTQVPYDFKTVLSDFAEEKEIDIKSDDKLSIVKKIQELLSTKYIYVDKANNNTNETDATLDFIIRSRKGDKDLFANGATMLYRLCGIPARRVDGFYLGEYSDGNYELENNDRHSWVEVYTSNYGWAPVEVCPDYYCENIDDYKFDRNINEEDNIEFVDIEKKHDTKKTVSIIGIVGACTIVIIIALVIKKNRDAYKARLRALGIENDEQLKLLRAINENYLLLKQNGYANAEVELIMLRIRFSTKKETKEDLDIILRQVEYMKYDKKQKRKNRNKNHKKK